MSFFKSRESKPFAPNTSNIDSPFIGIQAKLKMGESNDKYEQEADQVAEKVVSKSKVDSVQQKEAQANDDSGVLLQKQEEELQQKPIANEVTPLVQKKDAAEEDQAIHKKDAVDDEAIQKMDEEEPAVQKSESIEEDQTVQTKKLKSGQMGQDASIESRLKSSKGSGSPMQGDVRQEMESGFGNDFSNVKIHTDANAVQLSQEMGAQAFAHGNDVYFNKGKYDPSSLEGKGLLAHELTHTIQQEGATEKNPSESNSAIEKDANESTVGVMRKLINGGKAFGQKIMPRLKSGLRISACKNDKGKADAGTLKQELIRDTVQQGKKVEEAFVPPKYITSDLKTKMAAVILSEAYEGQESGIGWIYYNRVKAAKGESGLKASNPYRKKEISYKYWLYMLGDKTYAKEKLPTDKSYLSNYKTVQDYCDNNGVMKTTGVKRAKNAKALVAKMYNGKTKNPYQGWFGQGSGKDFNGNWGKWIKARAYYWLQVEGKVTNTWVKKLDGRSTGSTTFIFDEKNINAYWAKKENVLPKTVKKYKKK